MLRAAPPKASRAGRFSCLAAAFLILPQLGQGESADVRVRIIADTSICCHSQETQLNAGGADTLKMKGNENIILLRPDVSELKGKLVKSARVRLRETAENMMVRKVGVSTVSADWVEGKGRYSRAGPGESCFETPGRDAWAGPGSDFLGALWGRGGTFWESVIARRDENGWYEAEFDGRFLEACAAGLSDGIALSDDNGQTMRVHRDVYPASNYGNNFFYSREKKGSSPRLQAAVSAIEAPEVKEFPVSVLPWREGADRATGGVMVSWPAPAKPRDAEDVLGYRLRLSSGGKPMRELPRWLVPGPPRAGERVEAYIPGLAPGEGVSVEVETVGRGGWPVARASGAGFASGRKSAPAPLQGRSFPRVRGKPPRNSAGEVWAAPDLVKVNPRTGNVLEEPGVQYEGKAQGTYREANLVWSGGERTVRLAALRGEWVAFQVICAKRGAAEARFSVRLKGLRGPKGARIGEKSINLWRAWYQLNGEAAGAWYADPLLPLKPGEAFSVPDSRNAVPGQTNQAVYVEVFVPRNARPGTYRGDLVVGTAQGPLSLAVALKVEEARLPEEANFTWSLNAYESPGYGFGGAMSKEFLAAEREFYAIAHDHRATLAILHYSHSGRYDAAAAPPLKGEGEGMRIADWSQWDKRFAPLLDGKAFRKTSRPRASLDHFYLPLCEHYPTRMAEGYKWDSLNWEDHWLKAGTVEEGFSQKYREQWKAVAKQWLRRIEGKGWKTSFQVYLNDKYFYKQYDPKKKEHGQGVSFWLLDEPQHIDDFLALRFFGSMLREVQAQDRQRMIFRVDLSRPEWGRDTLERFIDLNVSGRFFDYPDLLNSWRFRYGHRIWTYGDSPSSRRSALSYSVQALDLYARGADGYVPWLVLGSEKNWTDFATTCVIYTGKPFGIAGPCPSLRLKAMRRAEQDVEYVRLLTAKRGGDMTDPSRFGLADLLRGILEVDRHMGVLDEHGTVTETYEAAGPEKLESLRREIAEELTEGGKSGR